MGEAAAHRRRTIGAAIWALVLLGALVAGLAYSDPAQGYRRISTLSINELQICRDGVRFQLGAGTFANIPGPTYNSSFQGAWREPFPDQTTGSVPPGSIAAARTLALPRHPVTFVDEAGFTEEDSHSGTFTIAWNVPLTTGELIQLRFDDISTPVLEVRGQQGVENCFLRTLQSSARMVGKGALTDPATGTTGSYAYIMSCDPTRPAGPFEVRYGTHRFRLTTVHGVSCADYSNVTTPAAGFDTQTGTGTGTLDGTPGAYIEWTFVDGGLGGLSDSAYISIRVPGSTPRFQGTAAPPGKFPGSTQLNGYNTAQAPSVATATAR